MSFSFSPPSSWFFPSSPPLNFHGMLGSFRPTKWTLLPSFPFSLFKGSFPSFPQTKSLVSLVVSNHRRSMQVNKARASGSAKHPASRRRLTTRFADWTDSRAENETMNDLNVSLASSFLKYASDRSVFSSERMERHVRAWCPSRRQTGHLCRRFVLRGGAFRRPSSSV